MTGINWGPVASVIIPALLLFIGTYGTVKVTRSGQKIDQAAKNYDQLQEDLQNAREELRLVKTEMVTMRADHARELAAVKADFEELIATGRHRERILEDHVYALRQHIVDQKGPPPPAWPQGLYR